jgi:hypothetical protein
MPRVASHFVSASRERARVRTGAWIARSGARARKAESKRIPSLPAPVEPWATALAPAPRAAPTTASAWATRSAPTAMG